MTGSFEHKITLELNRSGVQERIPVRQGDSLVHAVTVSLTDNGRAFSPAGAEWAQVVGLLPDGEAVTGDAKIGDKSCSFIPGSGFFAFGGPVLCRLILRGADGAELCSPAFAFDVERAFAGAVSAVPAEQYSRMAELLREMLEIQQKCEDTAVDSDYLSRTKTAPAGEDSFLIHDPADGRLASITWDALSTIITEAGLCPFEESGDSVVCRPYPGTELTAVQRLTVRQYGTPAPDSPIALEGYTEAVLTRCGKNALPYPYTTTSRTLNGIAFRASRDGTVTLTGTGSFTSETALAGFLLESRRALPPGDYILTGCPAGGGQYTYHISANIIRTDGTVDSVADYGSGAVMTVEDGDLVTVTVRIGGAIGTVSGLTLYPMLRPVGTDDGYEAYSARTFTAEFDDAVYGGIIDWQTGVMTVTHRALVIDGSDVKLEAADTDSGSYMYKLSTADRLPGMTVCSHFIPGDGEDGFLMFDCGGIVSGDNAALGGDGTEINEWLAEQNSAGEPVTVVYPMSGAYTVQLDPAELTPAEGVNIVWGDTGKVTVRGTAVPAAVIAGLTLRLAALEESE